MHCRMMMKQTGISALWAVWLLSLIGLAGYFGYVMFSAEDKSLYLIGETTHGHYQIELSCESCHTESFSDREVIQKACENCHNEELEMANDSHPKNKFTDPRNADRLKVLDARYCVECHTEHRPEETHPMGLTLPEDYCFRCHEDVAENRPTHEGLGFETCASAGCHNYHDNKALYEDFLVKHAADPAIAPHPVLPAIDHEVKNPAPKADAPSDWLDDHVVISQWEMSAHAKGDVNCGGCHQDEANQWVRKPTTEVCGTCHEKQEEGFLLGKHGMRIAAGLSPMTPAQSRLPMKNAHSDKPLNCISCHNDHIFDREFAAEGACMGCHNDEHSQAYHESKHAALWRGEKRGRAEQRGDIAEGQGVSCASCHLPRETHENLDGAPVVMVQHNQNANLRPNEKMIRSVCMNCHGLGFAIDALADPELIKNNFQGLPQHHIESIDMALERAKASQ